MIKTLTFIFVLLVSSTCNAGYFVHFGEYSVNLDKVAYFHIQSYICPKELITKYNLNIVFDNNTRLELSYGPLEKAVEARDFLRKHVSYHRIRQRDAIW